MLCGHTRATCGPMAGGGVSAVGAALILVWSHPSQEEQRSDPENNLGTLREIRHGPGTYCLPSARHPTPERGPPVRTPHKRTMYAAAAAVLGLAVSACSSSS